MGVERKSLIISERREEEHGLPRGRPCAGGSADAVRRSAAQGHDHPARGAGLGFQLDDKHYLYHKEYLAAQLATLMADASPKRSSCTTSPPAAGNNIERATDMARKMVCEWGMSELGPMSFGKREEQIFLGREIAQHGHYSEATAIRIDEQVKKLVQEGYENQARAIIEEKATRSRIFIALALLEREVLDGAEVHH